MVLNPVKIFSDSFTGDPLWENTDYVSPAKHRRMLRLSAKDKYVSRTDAKARYDATEPQHPFDIDKIGNEVFSNENEEEKAAKIVEREEEMDDESSGNEQEKEDEAHEKRQQAEIKKVKKLIEQLKPGMDGKTLVKPKKLKINPVTGRVQKKGTSKRAKMIQNMAKTKKLSKKNKLKA
jgi:ribosome biogenesis protein BRX1